MGKPLQPLLKMKSHKLLPQQPLSRTRDKKRGCRRPLSPEFPPGFPPLGVPTTLPLRAAPCHAWPRRGGIRDGMCGRPEWKLLPLPPLPPEPWGQPSCIVFSPPPFKIQNYLCFHCLFSDTSRMGGGGGSGGVEYIHHLSSRVQIEGGKPGAVCQNSARSEGSDGSARSQKVFPSFAIFTIKTSQVCFHWLLPSPRCFAPIGSSGRFGLGGVHLHPIEVKREKERERGKARFPARC